MRLCRIFVVMLLILACSSVAFAIPKNIEESEICIGGISLGTSLDYVQQVYGEPTSKKDYNSNNKHLPSIRTYSYNDLFVVSAYKSPNNKTWVCEIITKEPGLTTPSGFEVGKPFADVVKKYGKIKPMDKKMVKALRLSEKYTYYEYINGAIHMRFTVDKKGLIQEILCYHNY